MHIFSRCFFPRITKFLGERMRKRFFGHAQYIFFDPIKFLANECMSERDRVTSCQILCFLSLCCSSRSILSMPRDVQNPFPFSLLVVSSAVSRFLLVLVPLRASHKIMESAASDLNEFRGIAIDDASYNV